MEAEPRDMQLGLFGGAEVVGPKPEDEMPQDVKDAIAVVSGTAVPGEGGRMEGLGPPSEEDNAQKRWYRNMVKKGDHVNRITKLTEPNIRVLDLANDTDREEAERIYGLIGDPTSGFVGHESQQKMVLDPRAPKGYRCLVTIKWWKPKPDIVPIKGGPGYQPTGSATEQMAEVGNAALASVSGEQTLLG